MKNQAEIPDYLPYAAAAMWLWSGVQPIVSAYGVSLDLLAQTGIAPPYRLPVLAAASLLDIGFAFASVSCLRYRAGLWLAQCLTVFGYSLIIAFRLPEMWLHPFAPLVKNVPILALLFFLYQTNRKAKS